MGSKNFATKFRANKNRAFNRKHVEAQKLEHDLDRLVKRAAKCESENTRKSLLQQADAIRERLQQFDNLF